MKVYCLNANIHKLIRFTAFVFLNRTRFLQAAQVGLVGYVFCGKHLINVNTTLVLGDMFVCWLNVRCFHSSLPMNQSFDQMGTAVITS